MCSTLIFGSMKRLTWRLVMNIWKEMDSHVDSYTPKEMQIYNLVKQDPYSFTASTAMEIASRYHVSQSAISRFCQRLGFTGFSDFRLSMMMSANDTNTGKKNHPEKHEYIYYLQDYLSQINKTMTPSLSEDLIKRILSARNIYTSGYGASSIPAQWFSFRMVLSGLSAINIPSSQEMEYLHTINHHDVIFLYSASNPSHKDFFSLIDGLPVNRRPYIILVSYIKNHPFAKKADHLIVLPTWHSLDYQVVLDTNIGQIYFSILLSEKITSHLSE